jgi:predicted esterase YcpF (UPF0227 family)
MILFIHGFASCGLGQKSRLLTEHFGRDRVLAPDLPYAPAEAVTFLDRLLDEQSVEMLVGSSLGGYYATWLNRERRIPSVLINPAVRPWELLGDHLGPQQRWCDGQDFEFTAAHVEQLKALYRPQLRDDERYLVLLQSADEVLDYRAAAGYYGGHEVVIENGGNHRFENLADYLSAIDHFHQRNQAAR